MKILCDINGASVYLDENLLGTTPLEQSPIESGNHVLRVELPLYHDYTEEFVVKDGDTKTETITLKPAFGSLEISSAPEGGADVYLDNKKVGVTPYVNTRIASGKYVMRVTKNLFSDVEENVTVVDGLPMKRTVILGKNFAELTIAALEQTIFVNDRNVGTGDYTARLSPGKYTLRSERGETFTPDEKDVFLSIGEPTTVTLNARPRLGSVSVVVEPFEARSADIYVNKELKGKAPTSIPLVIGTHSILARSANFLDMTQTVSVKEGEQQKVTFTLTTYEGSRQASRDAWARSKWISAGVAVLAGAASYYLAGESDNYYDTYSNAKSTTAAQTARDNTDKYASFSGIALGTAAAGGVSALVCWIVQATK